MNDVVRKNRGSTLERPFYVHVVDGITIENATISISFSGAIGDPIPAQAGLAGVVDGSGNMAALVQPTTPADVQPVLLSNTQIDALKAQPAAAMAAGDATPVSSTVVELLAANPNRKKLLVQNYGTGNVRVSTNSGMTAADGIRLIPNGTLEDAMPNCHTGAIYAIREGLIDGSVYATESV